MINRRQHMNRRRIFILLQSRLTPTRYIKKYRQFFQVYTHVQCLGETYYLVCADGRWPQQQQSQAPNVYCKMRPTFERECQALRLAPLRRGKQRRSSLWASFRKKCEIKQMECNSSRSRIGSWHMSEHISGGKDWRTVILPLQLKRASRRGF
jgi:hypothetical protein